MYIVVFLCGSVCSGAEPTSASRHLRLDPVVVTLIEQVNVPAKEAGVLAVLDVREGSLVETGTALGRVEDDQVSVEIERATVEVELAAENAQNDVNLRFARKSSDLAKIELERALDSVRRFKKSISEIEIARLRLASQRAELEIEQAEHDLRISRITRTLKETELKSAALRLDRCAIAAPISGMVVEVYHRPGEWVSPGEPVVRMIRIDRLRVEGFLETRSANPDLAGCPVSLSVELPQNRHESFEGRIVFVSPETDPVNGQFRLWAEVENREALLRPGMHAVMTVDLDGRPPAQGASP